MSQPVHQPPTLTQRPAFDRVLGRSDLLLFSVSAILTIDTLASAASMGVPWFTWWAITMVVFFLPYGVSNDEPASWKLVIVASPEVLRPLEAPIPVAHKHRDVGGSAVGHGQVLHPIGVEVAEGRVTVAESTRIELRSATGASCCEEDIIPRRSTDPVGEIRSARSGPSTDSRCQPPQ